MRTLETEDTLASRYGRGKSTISTVHPVPRHPIDMIGFTLVIPFLTYFVQDLAEADGFIDMGSRDWWVGIVLASYTLGQFLFTPLLGSLSDQLDVVQY